MKFFTQLKYAILHKFTGAPLPASLKSNEGMVVYRDDATEKKPYISDGDEFREIMQRNRLADPVLPSTFAAAPITAAEGGTGKSNAGPLGLNTGNVGDILALNAAKDGYDFVPQGGAGGADNFAWYYVPALTTVTIPDNQVMYLINQIITVDGTLIVNGQYQQLTLD